MQPNPTYEEMLARIEHLEQQVAENSRSEKALRESRERYDRLSRNLQVVVYAAFPNKLTGKFYASEQIEAITGLPATRFLKEAGLFSQTIHPDDIDMVTRTVQNAIDKKTRMDLEYRIISSANKIKWIRDKASVVACEEGACKIEGLMEDITQSRRSEKELEAASKRWQDTFNAMREPLALLDLEYRILQCNTALRRLARLPENQIIGRRCWEVIPGSAHDSRDCPNQSARTDRRRMTAITDVGDRRFEVAVDPQFDEQGNITGFIHIMSDITDREKSARALRESHQTFLTVLDSIDALIYVADMDTHEILFMNRCVKKTFKGDFTGQKCWNALRGHPEPCGNCTNPQLIDNDGNPTGACVYEGRNSITQRWYVNYDRAIKWIDGRLVRLQVATDITQLKSMEQQRRQTERQLRQAQKMEAIGTLAGGIAHDFNNILSAILGYSELALDDALNDRPSPNYIREIVKAGGRARDLVQQILTFSRQTETEAKPIQVKPIVKEALKLLRASLPSTIEIETNIHSHAIVEADPIQIHQVIMNLCTNAGHAMRDRGGVLTVELSEKTLTSEFTSHFSEMNPGEFLMIEVKDTGTGIAPSIIDKIFDPYFTTKEKEEGTGMGLAVVQGIVQSCRGAVTIISPEHPENGAIFRVYLPIIHSNQPKVTQHQAIVPGGNEHILFVDDEPSLVDLSKKILERLGYRVTIRTSSLEALELFKDQPDAYDLVITDMTMPNMTGDIFAQQLMNIRPDIPVVICTGYSQKITPQLLERLKIRALVLKPIIRDELLLTVRQVLDDAKEG
jgi:PAS domain S-box-containing protein